MDRLIKILTTAPEDQILTMWAKILAIFTIGSILVLVMLLGGILS